jgi:hypothetical protein
MIIRRFNALGEVVLAFTGLLIFALAARAEVACDDPNGQARCDRAAQSVEPEAPVPDRAS